MELTVLCVSFTLLLLLGVPVAFAIGLSSVATIMGAREVALMAWGEKKASIVKKAVQGPVTVDVAASYLQKHPNAKFLLDKGAASLL